MKTYLNLTKIFAALVAAVSFTSCSNDDEQNKETSFVPTPVEFGVGLNGIAITRAAATTDWTGTSIANSWDADNTAADADKVALISFKDQQNTADVIDAHEYYVYSLSGTTATLKPVTAGSGNQFYWKNATETKKIIAWSLGTNTTIASPKTVPESFTITTDQSDDSFNEELLWGFLSLAYADRASSTSYDIPLYHQLARVDVNITANDASAVPSECYYGKHLTTNGGGQLKMTGTFTPYIVTSDASATITAIKAATAYSSWAKGTVGDYTDYTGAWSSQSTDGYIKPRNTASDGSSVNKTASYSAVVMPNTYAADALTLFEIVVDGITYKYIPSTSTTFDAGNKYVYNITISSTGLTVTATIQNWNTGAAIPGNAALD